MPLASAPLPVPLPACLLTLPVSPPPPPPSLPPIPPPQVFDRFVVVFFLLEAVFKLMALGPRRYLRSPSNRLDLFITVVGLTDLTVSVVFGCGNSKILIFTVSQSVSQAAPPHRHPRQPRLKGRGWLCRLGFSSWLQLLRSLRVLRLVRVLNAFTSLRVIVRAILFPMSKLVMVRRLLCCCPLHPPC